MKYNIQNYFKIEKLLKLEKISVYKMNSLISPRYGLITPEEIPNFYWKISSSVTKKYSSLLYLGLSRIFKLYDQTPNKELLFSKIENLPTELQERTVFYINNEEGLSLSQRMVKRLLLVIAKDDLEIFIILIKDYYYNTYEFIPEIAKYNSLKIYNFLLSEIERVRPILELVTQQNRINSSILQKEQGLVQTYHLRQHRGADQSPILVKRKTTKAEKDFLIQEINQYNEELTSLKIEIDEISGDDQYGGGSSFFIIDGSNTVKLIDLINSSISDLSHLFLNEKINFQQYQEYLQILMTTPLNIPDDEGGRINYDKFPSDVILKIGLQYDDVDIFKSSVYSRNDAKVSSFMKLNDDLEVESSFRDILINHLGDMIIRGNDKIIEFYFGRRIYDIIDALDMFINDSYRLEVSLKRAKEDLQINSIISSNMENHIKFMLYLYNSANRDQNQKYRINSLLIGLYLAYLYYHDLNLKDVIKVGFDNHDQAYPFITKPFDMSFYSEVIQDITKDFTNPNSKEKEKQYQDYDWFSKNTRNVVVGNLTITRFIR